MEFDMTMKKLNQGFKDTLQQKRDVYVFLCQDYVDIEILYDISQNLISRRDEIEKYLHRIHDLNPNSIRCSEMSKIFIEFFDI